ncbi:MAG: NAD-binding protein [Candidatus Cloacimonas sp.]|nr:NAD-binding protein [Candidatus Cloacimonas sp.]HNX02428.1 ion channel [Candidatus Cloacimonas sp.]HPS60741.1 ion channel [Candidatus Cloacimonas sp.]
MKLFGHPFRKLLDRFNIRGEDQKLLIRFLWVCSFIAILLLISALLAWGFEHQGGQQNSIKSFWDGIWWAIVTIATVGYGDKYPVTYQGRFVGIILIIVGYSSLSFFTGLVASLFVEDRLKGAKGLKQIRTHNHIVICGWNNTADYFLKAMVEKKATEIDICVVTNNPPEFFERLESRYPTLSLKFVRGETIQEETLKHASVETAARVIILADEQFESSSADDHSIIVANAVHYLAKKDRITVQLVNPENRSMLQRLGIQNIIVWDDIGGYVLANTVADNNYLAVFCQLAQDRENHLQTQEIPAEFIGKSFGELSDYYYQECGYLLLGVIATEPELELSSIFTEDSSGIDQFIQYALSKSRKQIPEEKNNVRWKPNRDVTLQTNDYAILMV